MTVTFECLVRAVNSVWNRVLNGVMVKVSLVGITDVRLLTSAVSLTLRHLGSISRLALIVTVVLMTCVRPVVKPLKCVTVLTGHCVVVICTPKF